MSKNYEITLDYDFQNDTAKKIRKEVNNRISWKTEAFKKGASLTINGGNTGLVSDGNMSLGYGFRVNGLKSYPYEIKGYFDSAIRFEDDKGNYSSEIYDNSVEETIKGFLSYLYTLEKEFASELKAP